MSNRLNSLCTWAALIGSLLTGIAQAQEPASCASPDPSQWPARSRPYFMVLVDSSGSMNAVVNSASNSCGYTDSRMGHAKCAVRRAVETFAGTVNFGLAQFAAQMTGCTSACYGSDKPNRDFCKLDCFDREWAIDGTCAACGYKDVAGDATTSHGANVLVPMRQDNVWEATPVPTNAAPILSYLDNNCTNNLEITNVPTDGPAYGMTPINGALRDMKRYFQSGWTNPDTLVTYPTPLTASDLACRSVNVILVTDGDETCDTQADAVAAAADLFNNGVTVGGKTFKVRVHVINLIGGSQANTNAIAAAGGTVTAQHASNETQLSQALSNIVATAMQPEVCDNLDNDCNGCADEGFRHYCNTGQTCCSWATQAQRNTCLTNYRNSITSTDPDGDPTKLPCTTITQSNAPATWLCYDPGDTCDNADNNCVDGADERQLKCGSPLHCPTAEACNGADDDCDGATDEALASCNACNPTNEICDGCDNDCDGLVDEDQQPIACGATTPSNCAGQLTCKPQSATVTPGACIAGGGFNACSNSPQPETCDGLDNDCDGITDDGVSGNACVPTGASPGLVFSGTSQCRKGTQACGSSTCEGFIGPSTEICDNIDNDCDGEVDENPIGIGQPCGVNGGTCVPGQTTCQGGALVCTGGQGPQQEICDGLDNDCDGTADEAPLADQPPANQQGCWDLPGNCCSYKNLSWCPPAGATCSDNGTLGAPCSRGTLTCAGGGWACTSARSPQQETCDGVDNDCDGTADDGVIVGAGQACGSDVGACSSGMTLCQSGTFVCSGQEPVAERCNGVDDDCDGETDESLNVGGRCSVPYDAAAYPGARDLGECRSGTSRCTELGEDLCEGGVGPSPEVCNGLDDDCDGLVDEAGAAPDGTDSSAGPNGEVVGSTCREPLGACAAALWTCSGGAVTCEGPEPAPELCDGIDNDCDGQTDESEDSPICGEGIDCVRHETYTACSYPCDDFRRGCPVGQACLDVVESTTGETRGTYCVPSADAGYTPPLRTARPDSVGCGCGSGPGDAGLYGFALLGLLLLARNRRVPAKAEVQR